MLGVVYPLKWMGCGRGAGCGADIVDTVSTQVEGVVILCINS